MKQSYTIHISKIKEISFFDTILRIWKNPVRRVNLATSFFPPLVNLHIWVNFFDGRTIKYESDISNEVATIIMKRINYNEISWSFA